MYQDFPIIVHSREGTTVDLNVPNIPDGGWVKFVPQKLTIGPNGSKATMIIAGIEEPNMGNPLADKPLIIEGKSSNGTATTILPVRTNENLAILHSAGPFELGSTTLNSNEDGMVIPGVVYDPNDNSNSTLQVNLSSLGMVDGSTIVPFPSWFSIKILKPSFTLNSDEPYYFTIETITHGAPSSGSYAFALDEEVGGVHYIGNATFSILNVRM